MADKRLGISAPRRVLRAGGVAVVAFAVTSVPIQAESAARWPTQLRPAPEQLATQPAGPWGPLTVLANQVVKDESKIATTDQGMHVVTWLARRTDGSFQARAAVQPPGAGWEKPRALSGFAEKAVDVQPVSWGRGNVSVFWERHVGPDDWQFRMRTVGAAGTWGPIITLRTARYAFPGFLVDVNDTGVVVLGWEKGDHRVRVAVRRADGSWRTPGPVPVVSPGTTFRFVSNPRAVFVTNKGHVDVVAWGRQLHQAGNALWLEGLGPDADWRSRLIGPTGGDTLGYDWVPQAQFAAAPNGDVAAVWSQRDPQTHQWTTLLRYVPAGGTVGSAQRLGHHRCDYLYRWCADLAISDTGEAVLAWAKPGSGGLHVDVARTLADGQLSTPQTVYVETVGYVFRGVTVDANAGGDATVNFIGGDAEVFYQEFARCPSTGRCQPLVRRENRPSWLDVLEFAVGPSGAATMTWVSGCSGGEACRPNHVWARRLASAD